MLQTLSGTVQCFVARSAYWITMNPLTMRRKTLKVVLRPLPLSTTNREKVSPHYITRREESSELQEDLLPSYSSSNYAMFLFFFKYVFIILLLAKILTGMALVSKEQKTQSDANERYNKKNALLLVVEAKENHTRLAQPPSSPVINPLQQSRRDKRKQQTDSMVSFKTAALRAKVNYAGTGYKQARGIDEESRYGELSMENRARSDKVLAEGSSRETRIAVKALKFAVSNQLSNISYVCCVFGQEPSISERDTVYHCHYTIEVLRVLGKWHSQQNVILDAALSCTICYMYNFILSTFAHLRHAGRDVYLRSQFASPRTSDNLMSKYNEEALNFYRMARLSWLKERKESKEKKLAHILPWSAIPGYAYPLLVALSSPLDGGVVVSPPPPLLSLPPAPTELRRLSADNFDDGVFPDSGDDGER
ncbi:hypothetical protein G5I_01299 [Acromyrmex echinatior]|uniref:Uncharacterized protein n=1 Tax=Acromyrmex echinatior TaxID=103372 RepID=F4W790_ACREC|nr:hypothetical protein G5I_01299 [Acromyrmex echinatior]